jgi:ABC-type antimicrobial peptide transport system permease subunit
VLHAEDPEAPMTALTTVSQLISTGNAYTRFHAALITVFGIFAALLASSGILGVVAYAVARRRREIGIRIAIGAAPRQAVTLVVREMTLPIVLGLGGGLILVYNLAFLLQRQGVLFEVQQFDPGVYGAVTLALASLVLVAAWLPARSAARIDPRAALRCP